MIAPDLIGAGGSDQPADRELGLADQAGYVLELLDHLGIERLAIVGHGSGGGVAQLLALDHPGVAAMVLLNPDVLDAPPPVGGPITVRATTGAEVDVAISVLLESGARQRRWIDGDLIEAYARPYRDEPAALERASAIGSGGAARAPELTRIVAPVLILWGEDDPFAPTDAADRLNEAIASSTLGLLPGCGHFLPDEAAETLAPMVAEWLRAMYLRVPHGHPDDPKDGVVLLQLERRPPWVDLAEDEADDWFVEDDEGRPGP